MRLYPQGRWQRRFWWATLLTFSVVCWWAYLVVTRSPIHLTTFVKLKSDVARADVEALLGGPANYIRNLDPPPKLGDVVPFQSDDDEIPGTLSAHTRSLKRAPLKIGELDFAGPSLGIPRGDRRFIVEVHSWDGAEGRITVSFDKDGLLIGARYRARLTLRTKLREWLPWFP